MGRGIIYKQNELVNWKDDSFAGISVMSFVTGWGFSGSWIFNEELGNLIIFVMFIINQVFTSQLDHKIPANLGKLKVLKYIIMHSSRQVAKTRSLSFL